MKVDAENNLLHRARRGAGRAGGYVVIRKAIAAKPEPQPQVEKPKKAGEGQEVDWA